MLKTNKYQLKAMFFLDFLSKYSLGFTIKKKNHINATKLFITAAMLFVLSACQTYQFNDVWPAELPARKTFIEGYLKKRGLTSTTNAQLEYHLGWIKKFYLGTTLYPNGWISISNQYLATIKTESERINVNERLVKLGISIGNEWAQDNDIRLINSANIATWASAIQTAAERREYATLLERVESDVSALIKKELNSNDIKYERYFAEESYDGF